MSPGSAKHCSPHLFVEYKIQSRVYYHETMCLSLKNKEILFVFFWLRYGNNQPTINESNWIEVYTNNWHAKFCSQECNAAKENSSQINKLGPKGSDGKLFDF